MLLSQLQKFNPQFYFSFQIMNDHMQYDDEAESPTTLKYEDIYGQLERDAILEKSGHYGPTPQQRIKILGLPKDIEQMLLNKYHSRDRYHLIRLIERGGVEKEFAIAYIQHASLFIEESSEGQNITEVINSEGTDTMIFWTFGPYLYKALTNKGIGADKSIGTILFWAKDGISVANSRQKNDASWNYINLKGLDFLNKYNNGAYILSADPTHISHKFTEQEAERIAKLLIV